MNHFTFLPYRSSSFIKKMCTLVGAFMLLGVMVFQNTAWGIVSLNLTRAIIDQNVKETSVRVLNEANTPVLIQAWMDKGSIDATPEYIDVPFIITTPLFRLETKAAQHLRILFTGAENTLPADRESVFWLNIQEVPPTTVTATDEDYIQIAFRTRIKLFYRPKSIPFDTDHLHKQLTFKITEDNGRFTLQMHNPTPIHVTTLKITIGSGSQKVIETFEPKESMVAPYSSLSFPLEKIDHAPASNTFINYIYLNDFGVPVENQKQLSP